MSRTHFVHSEAYKKIVDAARKNEKEKLVMSGGTAKERAVAAKQEAIAKALRIIVGAYSQEYKWLATRIEQAADEIYDAGKAAGRKAGIEEAAKIAEHPYRLGEVDGSTKPTEVGEAIAAEIRRLAEEG